MFKLIEDLFLTDTFLIKGRLENKLGRLTEALEASRDHFLTVRDATLVDLRSRERIETPRVGIARSELILAHEFIDAAGDPYRKSVEGDRTLIPIRAFVSGRTNIEISGTVPEGAYEIGPGREKFFVVRALALRGLRAEGHPDLELLERLDYAIVNRSRLAYLYDFHGLVEVAPDEEQEHGDDAGPMLG